MKNVSLLTLSIALVLFSCSDSDNEPNNPIPNPSPQPENPYKTGKDLSSSKWKKWKNTGTDNNYFMLGYGYDATGKYAHPAWLRNKIFDIDKYKADKRQVMILQIRTSSAEINFSGTKAECLNRLASLGGFSESESRLYKNLFKATFETTFSDDTSFSDLDYYYTGGSSTYAIYLARFMYNKRIVSKYLTNEFKSDVEMLSPDKLISKYGTHLLCEVYVGRRIDYLYRANCSDFNILLSWSNYNANHFFRIPNSGVTIYKPKVENPQKENLSIEIVDDIHPNPNAWMLDITNYQSDPVTFKDWNDVTDENVTLINFSEKALIPIYEVIDDSSKKEEIKEAYERYLKG